MESLGLMPTIFPTTKSDLKKKPSIRQENEPSLQMVGQNSSSASQNYLDYGCYPRLPLRG